MQTQERRVEVLREAFGVPNGGYAVVLGADDEDTFFGNEARAREWTDDAIRSLEGGMQLVRALARTEATLIARRVGYRREGNHGHDEREVGLHGREKRHRVAAETHAHDADARRAAFTQHGGEHA